MPVRLTAWGREERALWGQEKGVAGLGSDLAAGSQGGEKGGRERVITINQSLTPAARNQQRKQGVEIYGKEIRRGWTRVMMVFRVRPK